MDNKAKRLMHPTKANRGSAAAEFSTLALQSSLQSPGAAAAALNPSAGMVLSSVIVAALNIVCDTILNTALKQRLKLMKLMFCHMLYALKLGRNKLPSD